MCEFAGASAVASIASAAVGLLGVQQRYEGQKRAYEEKMEAFKQNAINASQATEDQYSNLGTKAIQEDMSIAQQQSANKLAEARAISQGEVAASEGGVRGNSVGHVLNDIYRQAGNNQTTLDSNQRMMHDYLQGEMKAALYSGQNQINSLAIPEKPSLLGAFLEGAGVGLNNYNDYLDRKARYRR
ncbi:hypothetical protein [Bartonella sp. DGB2]|uniref:virion core protein, T7 gp14 family n=1 Tax=Bartonella sp. DGB2 TaxID=3388426 RepID=UPI00398FADA9